MTVNKPGLLEPIRIAIAVGFLGAGIIGLLESLRVVLGAFNGALPSLPPFSDLIAFAAGLFFICLIYALAGAVAMALLGLLVGIWQRIRGTGISPDRLTLFFVTVFGSVYVLFRMLDRLGIQELRSASVITEMAWIAILGFLAAAAAVVIWRIGSQVFAASPQRALSVRRPFRQATIGNAAMLLLVALIAVPLCFVGWRSVVESRSRETAVHAQGATAEEPNIVFITIDALRADHLGAYGYAPANTPNMDALAAQGALFNQANSQAPWTFPSFASMFTSQYPSDLNLSVDNSHISEMYRADVPRSVITLAEVLQDAGYFNKAIVTNPWLRGEFGFDQGFENFQRVDDARIYHIGNLEEMSLLSVARQMPRAYNLLRTNYMRVTGDFGLKLVWDVRADRVTDATLSWLNQRPPEPFFLWVHYIDPHYPFDPPAGYRPQVDDVSAARMQYLSSYNEEDVYTGRARLRSEDKDALIALYDGEIAYTDLYVGKLVDAIDALGIGEDTVVILSSDHGDEFWEHGGYQHGHSLYDELIHVPLLLRWPGRIAAGQHITADVEQVDLMPTMLEIAGAEIPASARGHSLMPLLQESEMKESDREPARYNFAEALFLTEEKKTVRGDGYKLIYAPHSETVELYDLDADPGERINVADDEPALVEALFAELTIWFDLTGSVLPASDAGHSSKHPDPSTVDEFLPSLD